jgi:hypothetical protein
MRFYIMCIRRMGGNFFHGVGDWIATMTTWLERDIVAGRGEECPARWMPKIACTYLR